MHGSARTHTIPPSPDLRSVTRFPIRTRLRSPQTSPSPSTRTAESKPLSDAQIHKSGSLLKSPQNTLLLPVEHSLEHRRKSSTLLLIREEKMRRTLRRSCSACAKSKHSCDLRTPRCSRCVRRQVQCLYANEPLSAPDPPGSPGYHDSGATTPSEGSGALTGYRFGALDPFESYPQTRLPREHVQRLIHSCTYVSHALPLVAAVAHGCSPPQDRFPVLPPRPQCVYEPLPCVMVAACAGRPRALPRLAADGVS